MNEYNYNNNNEQQAQNNNEVYTGFSTDANAQKQPKKHRGIKAAAFIMAMALVSAGSIGAYRQFAGENVFRTSSSSESSEKDSVKASAKRESSDTLNAQNVSIINTKKTTGNELSTEEIVEKLLPSVVGIESSFTVENARNSFSDFGFGFDFGGSSMPSSNNFSGTGTGVIISENGYIVTNAHVIFDSEYGAGLADSVSVITEGDKTYDAEVIEYDVDCDLAVIKIDEEGLTAAEFGNSDELKLGESVIAIGNPLGFDLKNTVTGGMISGLDRNITINDKAMNLIQTDAAINSGNSGGPLINKYGQVIGINSSKMSSSYASSGASIEGIGFAIPSNLTSSIIDDLMKYGYVTGKPQLGISCQDVTETVSKMYDLPVGIYVYSVSDGSAADKAGIRKGDIIVEIEGKKVKTGAELTAEKNKYSAGETVEIKLIRDGDEKTVKVTLDEQKREEKPEDDEKDDTKKDKDSKKADKENKSDEAEDKKAEEDEKIKKPADSSRKDKKDIMDNILGEDADDEEDDADNKD
ncbi:MAG: trypsin-like peptidase domain-containing protein [Ruminococcus sp.]|uniref:S1C family serine protease n=1 Tax=Ruminococcus sp. TaxID=41978 RepID=UPI0025D2F32D|nr:trypsin-like peptidase domain-containing protein [Ruminococcus sp.]MCR5599575.1 trypsin-like peptidase domain-containing protein [Ruminococcus sp.]